MRRNILIVLALLGGASEPLRAEKLAIVGGTLIDVRDGGRSTADIAAATGLLDGDRTVAAGPSKDVRIPPGTRRVAARGRFIVPGLIDGFGSVRSQGFASAYLYEGVTTVFLPEPSGADTRRGKPLLTASPAPRLFLGSVVTSYGQTDRSDTPMQEHRLNDVRLTRAEMTALLEKLRAGGARAVLIHYDTWPDDVDWIVRETRRLGMGTIGELGWTGYHYAARAGVQSFVHSSRYLVELTPPDLWLAYGDQPFGRAVGPALDAAADVDPAGPAVERYGNFLAGARATLMPTLAMQLTSARHGLPNPWRRPSAVLVQPEELHNPTDRETGLAPLGQRTPEMIARRQAQFAKLVRQDARLHTLGVRYLAASGCSAFGIMPGGGMHLEMAVLHDEIGLSPREALAAATSNYADAFGWSDVGRVEPGRAADVVIVKRDPRTDVHAVEDIDVVIARGRLIDRPALLRPPR